MDRDALADFLRGRREALSPGDIGLTVGPRRRAPGLRREEVAQLTGMSVDYYSRLEQRRGPQPSTQMLAALARTLRLGLDERDHLFRLAGHPAPERTASSTYVRPALIHVLDQLDDCAAFVCSDLEVLLAQNRLSVLLMGDLGGSGLQESMAWKWFLGGEYLELVPPEDRDHQARIRVAALRAAWSRRRGDADVDTLVDELLTRSEEFRQLWERHEVGIPPDDHKTFIHPRVGRYRRLRDPGHRRREPAAGHPQRAPVVGIVRQAQASRRPGRAGSRRLSLAPAYGRCRGRLR